MGNIFDMVKQASQLRKEMKNIEAALADKKVEHTVSGGRVKVVARGDMRVESITIAPEMLAPDKAAKLQELLLSAVNGALNDAKKKAGSEMSKLAGGLGLNLPGMGG